VVKREINGIKREKNFAKRNENLAERTQVTKMSVKMTLKKKNNWFWENNELKKSINLHSFLVTISFNNQIYQKNEKVGISGSRIDGHVICFLQRW
jgi:hypothetical protein